MYPVGTWHSLVVVRHVYETPLPADGRAQETALRPTACLTRRR
jgi:hypothetical protein